MKKSLLVIALFVYSFVTNAQIIDTFESNKFGWQEFSQKSGSAIIADGVLKLKGCSYGEITQSSCYAPIDPQKNFEIKCSAYIKKIDYGTFGIVFDYRDDYNMACFCIKKNDNNAIVQYIRYWENKIVGIRTTELKLPSKKNAKFDFSIKHTYNDIEFYCNNMKIMGSPAKFRV